MDLGSSPDSQPDKVERPIAPGSSDDFFLNRFLDGDKPEEEAADEPVAVPVEMTEADKELQAAIIEALREIYDPEIPVNIYELGLIYEVNVSEGSVEIVMTLTTPHCPVAETMPGEIELKAGAVPGVGVVEVKLVWEPPWDMSLMSDEARLELGLL